MHCFLWAVAIAMCALAVWLANAEAGDGCPRGAPESFSQACAQDDTPIDGYWQWDYWVPGLVRVRSQFLELPLVYGGRAVWYAPGVMEATAEARGLSLLAYVDGVASMSCADLGLPLWIDRGFGYEGPFLVVDCPQLDDIYSVVVHREEAIEVGWRTAEEWGIQSGGWEVRVSRVLPTLPNRIKQIRLRDWFLERAKFYPRVERLTLDPRPIFRAPSTWRLYGEWITFEAPTWQAWEHGR